MFRYTRIQSGKAAVGAMGDSEPRSVEEVFKDFKGRRAAIIKALTTDFGEFYRQCDPEKKENLCLFGFPDERWEVKPPTEEVPTVLPEPVLGINAPRDRMQQKNWLCLIAIYSDVWLLSLAFYFGSRNVYDRAHRRRLFDMINELPMIFEVVLEAERAKEQSKGNKGSTSKSKSKNKSRPRPKYVNEDSGEEDNNQGEAEAECAACEDGSVPGELCIFCDTCHRWFHMKCVNITPSMAEHIEEYECPSCSQKRTCT